MTQRSISAAARAMSAPFLNSGAQLRTQQGIDLYKLAWDERLFPMGEHRNTMIPVFIPPAWDGSTVTVTFRLRSPSTTGNSIWELYYAYLPTGIVRSTVVPVIFDLQKTVATPGTAYYEYEVSFSATPLVSPSNLVYFQLKRRGDLVTDTTGDIAVTDFWFTLGDTGGGGPGSGEVNTASNLGSGSGWFKHKIGVDIRFKSLITVAPLQTAVNPDDLTLSVNLAVGFTEVTAAAPTLTIAECFEKHVSLDCTLNDVDVMLPTPTANEHGKSFTIQKTGTLNASIAIPPGITHYIAGMTASPIPLPVQGDVLQVLYRHTPTARYYLI